jgi:hypothetical protein
MSQLVSSLAERQVGKPRRTLGDVTDPGGGYGPDLPIVDRMRANGA